MNQSVYSEAVFQTQERSKGPIGGDSTKVTSRLEHALPRVWHARWKYAGVHRFVPVVCKG